MAVSELYHLELYIFYLNYVIKEFTRYSCFLHFVLDVILSEKMHMLKIFQSLHIVTYKY